jgi:hypothetical protein
MHDHYWTRNTAKTIEEYVLFFIPWLLSQKVNDIHLIGYKGYNCKFLKLWTH